jgi:hypothetical protein
MVHFLFSFFLNHIKMLIKENLAKVIAPNIFMLAGSI